MDKFEEAYQELNPAQRRAVDVNALDGPVLVVAGPGTGKTQLLSMRVANILRKTDTDPAAILCLTFTNKAATNMRDRLVKLAGPSARDVMVRTFHSFAAEIMNIYPDYFWNGARLSVAPDAVQLEIIESILSDLPFANPLALKFAGQFTAVKDVQQGLKLVKEAGLTPDKLRAIINLNLAYIDEIEPLLSDLLSATLSNKNLDTLAETVANLPTQGIDDSLTPLLSLQTVLQESLALAVAEDKPTGKTMQTGKWKRRFLQTIDGQKGLFDERRRNNWWLALADVYERYRDVLHARGYYDYADMLVEVIAQLERHSDLRASVQERFLYVLIDEFQDTNAAQLRLSHLVADHYSANGKPNIMAVGDDDQSIYKFNGAELSNMLSFQRTYPDAQLFVLTDNYRSSQAVLDTARQVIEQANDRLVKREPSLKKDLKAVNAPKKPSVITHLSYPSRDHELSGIARTLAKERASHNGSIAVLARSHESLRSLAGRLSALNVPVRYEQSNDILTHPAVKQVYLLASLVSAIQAGDERSTNYLISTVLRHPMWQLTPLTLWQLASANFGKRDWLTRLTESNDTKLQAIGHWLLWLAAEADNQPVSVMIEYLIGLRAGESLTSPLREYYLDAPLSDEYLSALSAIKLLRQLTSEFAGLREAKLADFVRLVDVMTANGQVVADESVYAAHDKAVELYTVYKAKGLEFDSVYVLDAVEKNWQPRSGGRKPPANLPLQPAGDDFDDYVRLLYVALTRAKQDITIASYRSDEDGTDVLATPLIRSTNIKTKELTLKGSGNSLTVLEETLRWPTLPSRSQKQILQSRLDNYSLSATHLLSFLDVTSGGPDNFVQRHLLQLPQAQTANMAFGSAIHAALEAAQKQVNAKTFSLKDTQKLYGTSLTSQQLPQAEFERYLVHGHSVLENLFNSLTYELPVGSLPEQACGPLDYHGVRLGGKLDRIDLLSAHQLRIVDYKTGVPLTSFDTKDRTKQIKAWRYKTQLLFYLLLVGNSPRFKAHKDLEAQIVFVEAETPRELTRDLVAEPQDLERLSKLIQVVWQHIIGLNFVDTSSYSQDIAGIRQFEQDLLDERI